jgi:hypothetical protein
MNSPGMSARRLSGTLDGLAFYTVGDFARVRAKPSTGKVLSLRLRLARRTIVKGL